jgi:hypothetical protein
MRLVIEYKWMAKQRLHLLDHASRKRAENARVSPKKGQPAQWTAAMFADPGRRTMRNDATTAGMRYTHAIVAAETSPF